VEPKLRGWGEDALSKQPSNPCDPHGRPNTYLAAKQSTRVRRSTSIEGSRSHGAQSAARKRGSGQVESKSRSPQLGFHDSRMVQSTPSTSEGERRDPPIGGSYHLARPNWPLDSSILRARADPPNRGFMTLVWSNRPPLRARARGETPQSGAHTILQGPTGPSTPVF